MGKAIIDDLLLAMQSGSQTPQQVVHARHTASGV
ncbi:hypothetical protein [Pseudomonas salmasensis]